MENKYHDDHVGGDEDEPEHANSGVFVQKHGSGRV